MFFAGFAKLALGADEEAVARFRRAVEINRNFSFRISGSPPRWQNSVGLMKRNLLRRRDWRSIRLSPSPASDRAR
jgi:hypothetical protein